MNLSEFRSHAYKERIEFVRAALVRNNWRIAHTARELQIGRRRLYEFMQAAGITKPVVDSTRETLRDFRERQEREFLQRILTLHRFNITRAASALRTSRNNLQALVKKHGLTSMRGVDPSASPAQTPAHVGAAHVPS